MSTTIDRRLFVKSLLGTAVLGALAACSPGASAGPVLTAADPLPPTEVPPGTALKVAAPNGAQKLALELSGLIDRLPFTVPEWANVSAGPDVINAFRAKSLELASNAGDPADPGRLPGYDARSSPSRRSTRRHCDSRRNPEATSPPSRISVARRSPSRKVRPRAWSCCAS